MIRNPGEAQKIRQGTHRTPYDLSCTPHFYKPEDLAHEFRTDLLQIRLEQPIAVPVNLPEAEREEFTENFVRTLAEALRLGGSDLLGIDSRELAVTTRRRAFGSPEIVLYDGIAGGAGYAQMLQGRNLRALLNAGRDILDCPADCTDSCRACLRGYDNQHIWERFQRCPVLSWVDTLLGTKREENPFAKYGAAPFVATALSGSAVVLKELETATHLIATAPTLFELTRQSDADQGFAAAGTLGFLRALTAWMAGGGKLEIALGQPPNFDPAFPNALVFANWLAPCLNESRLRLWRLPKGFQLGQWPRLVFNPGRTKSSAYFSLNCAGSFLDAPLLSPAWKSPGFSEADIQAWRAGWTPLDGGASLPKKESVAIVDYQSHQNRRIAQDFAFCKEGTLERLRIEDPHCLKNAENSASLRGFLDALAALWPVWPKTVELKVHDTADQELRKRLADLERWLASKGSAFKREMVPAHGPGKRDFHDRRLVFDFGGAKERIGRVVVLLTGGIDRYLSTQYETSVIRYDQRSPAAVLAGK